MTRRDEHGSRVTEPGTVPYDTIPPFRKRNPVMFWSMMLAVVAMVLSTVAAFVIAVL